MTCIRYAFIWYQLVLMTTLWVWYPHKNNLDLEKFVHDQKNRSVIVQRFETWTCFHCRTCIPFFFFKDFIYLPWLVCLSGLSAGLWTKGLLVQFPVRAHAWLQARAPAGGCMRGNHTLMFLGEGREKEGGKEYLCERKTSIGFLSHAFPWGPGLQPRHVPWLGIKPVTFGLQNNAQLTEPPHQLELKTVFFILCYLTVEISIWN